MKEFNIEGVCVPEHHYMVNIEGKLKKILAMIEKRKYFVINRARQYGKTTTLALLEKELIHENYAVIFMSFEGIGDTLFESETLFCSMFLNSIQENLDLVVDGTTEISNFKELSQAITKLIRKMGRPVVLLLDEVDKCSNNQIFLSFLGMLRQKYLMQNLNKDQSFYSVVLAGVHDIKNLKLKLRKDEQTRLNSPWTGHSVSLRSTSLLAQAAWNIAADFDVEMSFSQTEITTMLEDYEKDHRTGMDIETISYQIAEYTAGYPFLVSKICKVLDEKLSGQWTMEGLQGAVKLIVEENNTLFGDLVKNLENDHDLYNLVDDILIGGNQIPFNLHNPLIDRGVMFGILTRKDNLVSLSNQIFELLIYNYMISKRTTSQGELVTYAYREQFVKENMLDMELVLTKFQEIMHDEYRDKDEKFIEREGRLLFLCFLKPVINGSGFYFVEPQTRMDDRMDVVVTYGRLQYIIELKIWHGENYEEKALEQLERYLQSKRENKGYLITFCFNKNKEYKREWIKHKGIEIFSIIV